MDQQQKAPRGNAGPEERDHTASAIAPPHITKHTDRQRLDLFLRRSREMVERVNSHAVYITDAVFDLHQAAYWSGLMEDVGEARIQEILRIAFMGAARRS